MICGPASNNPEVLVRFGAIVESGVGPVVAELAGRHLVRLEAVVERPAKVSGDGEGTDSTQYLNL